MTDVLQTRARFEIEALEWAEGTLELTGRWSGVRGKRFVRPTLTSDDGTRLLASLDDKPWHAEDGSDWRAAFPCEQPPPPGREFTLTVGGDIEVALRVPGEGDEGRFPRPDPSRQEADEARAELASANARLDLMRSEIRSAQDRIDSAREERQVLAIARERAEADLRRVTRERDAALGERDEARAERTAMRRERDGAVKDRAAADKARNGAVKQRDAMQRERDKAVAERNEAKQERKRRDAEVKELRGALAAAQSQMQAEAQARTTGAPDLPPPPQPLAAPVRSAPWRHQSEDGDPKIARAIAAVALFLVLVLLVILL